MTTPYYLAIRRASYDNLTSSRKLVFGAVMARTFLAVEQVYINPAAVEWYVWHHAFEPEDLARVGTIVKYIGDVPANYFPPLQATARGIVQPRIDQAALWADVRTLATSPGNVPLQDRVVRLDTGPVAFDDRADLDQVLLENTSSNAVAAAAALPANWTLVP